MATYFITGDVDQACAELKTTLEADDVKFAAELNAHLNAAPTLRRALATPSMPIARPAAIMPAAKPAPAAPTLRRVPASSPIAKPAAPKRVAKPASFVPARNVPPATPVPLPSTSSRPYFVEPQPQRRFLAWPAKDDASYFTEEGLVARPSESFRTHLHVTSPTAC